MVSAILRDEDIKSINLWITKMKQYKTQDKEWMTKAAVRALKLDYKIIGYGYERVTYDLRNGYVLKVATSELGLKSNKNEFIIYNNCHAKLKEHLCPIKDFGYGWIIMKKMTVPVPRTERYDNQLKYLKKRFRKYGVRPKDLVRPNLALTKKGKIVFIDYGDFTLK
ncbi:hypothetical protein ASG61_29735 [Bacillus sp. Leaf75]|nr:hypothetical protein ASG61_29735 [Bacillus sp. Leaf75]